MKVIVGLGNPGEEYENTRHNIGFYMLDKYFEYKKNDAKWKKKFNGLYKEMVINGEKVLFLKPLSYMNLSGTVVSEYVNFFKVNIDDLLIISDDLDLNIGNYKLKEKGSSGGHNGLKSIQQCLKTDIYKRLKIGISNDKRIDTKDYVLSKFSKDEKIKLEKVSGVVNSILDDFLKIDFSKLMNLYNKKNR